MKQSRICYMYLTVLSDGTLTSTKLTPSSFFVCLYILSNLVQALHTYNRNPPPPPSHTTPPVLICDFFGRFSYCVATLVGSGRSWFTPAVGHKLLWPCFCEDANIRYLTCVSWRLSNQEKSSRGKLPQSERVYTSVCSCISYVGNATVQLH